MRNVRKYLSPKYRLMGVLATLVLIALSTAGFSTPKDYAVVVGVDQVTGISQSLKGASTDAQDFAEQLRHRGIEPVVLLNGQATRAAITSAIAGGAKADNLIFYFAGLGSGPNTPRLMTEDKKGLPLEDLDKLLLKAGAGSTTAILDTSFSGLRAEKSGPSLFTSRYYEPPSRDVGIQNLGANAAELPGLSHKKICYITAGRFNEDAFEDSINGKARGVFTHYLCGRLNTDQPVAWQTIQWDVAAQVAAHVDDQQHPNFPVAFLANAAFEGAKIAPAEYGGGGPEYGPDSPPNPPLNPNVTSTPSSRTLWTLFNVDNVDPRLVSLSMRPNKAEVAVEEPLEFELTVGKAGYLVVVEHSVEGTLVPIFPRDGDIDSAQVRAGQQVVIPEPGVTAFADRSGKERLKALLFDDEQAARELLAGLLVPDSAGDSGASFGNASKRLQSRGIRFARDARSAQFGTQPDKVSNIPVTADLNFRVVSK